MYIGKVNELSEHENDCLSKPIKCEYSKIGCNYDGMCYKYNINDHYSDNALNHSKLVCDNILNNQDSLNKIFKQLTNMQRQINNMSSEIKNLKAKNIEKDNIINILSNEINELKSVSLVQNDKNNIKLFTKQSFKDEEKTPINLKGLTKKQKRKLLYPNNDKILYETKWDINTPSFAKKGIIFKDGDNIASHDGLDKWINFCGSTSFKTLNNIHSNNQYKYNDFMVKIKLRGFISSMVIGVCETEKKNIILSKSKHLGHFDFCHGYYLDNSIFWNNKQRYKYRNLNLDKNDILYLKYNYYTNILSYILHNIRDDQYYIFNTTYLHLNTQYCIAVSSHCAGNELEIMQ